LTANGLRINNGANVSLGLAVIGGFNNNVYLDNVGDGPELVTVGLGVRNATSFDLLVENPNAKGSLFGLLDFGKTLIDPGADFSSLILNPNTVMKGVAALGPLFAGRTTSEIVNIQDSLLESLPLGVIEGGELSDAGGFNLHITAGFGYAKSSTTVGAQLHRITWQDQTITLPINQSNFIMVDTDGVIFTTSAFPDLITAIELGRVITNIVNIKAISRVPGSAFHTTNRIDRSLRDSLGPIYVTGSLVAENPITDRALNVSSGRYFFSYFDFRPSGGTPITFAQVNHSSGSFVFTDNQTQVNNTQYDDGSDLVSLTAGFYAKHSLYVSGENAEEVYFVVISQDEYPDQITAEGAFIPIPPSSFFGSVVLIASIVVQEGNSNIVQIFDERPTLGFRASGISATAEHGNLFGLLNDDHPQYLLINGTRAMTGNFNMNSFDIVNVDEINGVIIQNHGTRHNPNSIDPITTASAVNLTPISTSTIGIADSVARSDHTHGMIGFQPEIEFQNDGVLVGGEPHSTINFTGVVNAFDVGGGVLEVNVIGGVTMQDEGIDVPNSPHNTLNFIGSTISATDAGGGTVNITVTPVTFRNEGIVLSESPHTDINFIGGGVTASNFGGGQAHISIPGITFQQNTANVGGAPHDTANFSGNGVSLNNGGGGIVNISVPGITFRDEGINLGGAPHTILNFTGSSITAVNSGGGVATLAVRTPRVSTAAIGEITGTTQIPFTNTAPNSTQGTQIVSNSIVPQATSSRIRIALSFSWEAAATTTGLAVAVFRGSTLIGMTVDTYAGGGTVAANNLLRNISLDLVDSPNTTSPVTYSVRAGTSSETTWRINNKANGNNFGSALISAQSFILEEILG
jgi:hypothetical protein